MAKIRVIMLLTTLIVVGIIGLFTSYYARGYRFSLKTLKFSPNGILVIKSEPDGASVYINGNLKTATNATISISPGVYDVEVKKEGFLTWKKRLEIKKEIVTQAGVTLFKNAPSLSPVTFSGAYNPISSHDGTKVAFSDENGLWTTETYNLPIGFANSPKKIADGNLIKSTYQFSPDGNQILLNISNNIFVIDSGSLTPQSQWVNISSKKESVLSEWKMESLAKNQNLIKNLPTEISYILQNKTSDFIFSPDENMILYKVNSDTNLPSNLIPQLPGSSTQEEERNLQAGYTYIYDIKEDRNFLIGENSSVFYWMPDSRRVLNPIDGKIVIMDYDGTNKQTVYSGSYIAPFAFPYRNTTKLLVLTNLGASSQTPNLYELTIK